MDRFVYPIHYLIIDSYIPDIIDKGERQRYLDLAENCGLDLAQITKRVVENIRSKSDVDISSITGTRTEPVDTNISEVQNKLSLVVRKPVFGVSDQVRHKPGCAVTEGG